MNNRFAFLLSEFAFLRIETIANHIEHLFNQNDEEAFLFVGKPVNSPYALQKNENIILNLAKSNKFDGILSYSNSLVPFNGRSILNKYLYSFENSRIVTIGDSKAGFSSITLDNYRSIQLTINHLFEHGLRKFAYISGPLTNNDASERHKGIKDFLKEKAMTLEDFFEGDYTYECGERVVKQYFENHKKLPEAFIFANDEMAIGAYATLIANGIRIPQDVKIVGFDDSDRGRYIESPLTTINQRFLDMTLAGLDILRHDTTSKVVLSGELITRESCGCESQIKQANEEYFEKKVYIEKYHQLNQTFMDNLELQSQLANLSDYTQLKNQLKAILGHYHNFEFHICLFKENTIQIDNPLSFSFPKEMNCFLSLVNGEFHENIDFETESILPTSIKEKTTTRVFFVYPLRMNDIAFGYIVCNTSTAQDRRFVSLKDLLNISLNRIEMERKLASYKKELEDLSYKDSLTKSFNHRGFHFFSDPLFIEYTSKGLRPAVIYSDVDYLKMINDTFGHETGDKVIVAASDLLNEYFPNEIVARIGGDEYIVFIKDFSKYNQKKMKEDFEELMSKKNEELNKEFTFKMSFGFCVYDALRHKNLEEMIREADNLLYEERRLSNHYYSKTTL